MYRVGNHQPQNVYRDDRYIGVMFDPQTAAEVVAAMNEAERLARLEVLVTERLVDAPAVDSCTCVYRPNGGADPNCPVHQGRRARGPKPPPLGPGCICDGSGRTCPRHGVVL